MSNNKLYRERERQLAEKKRILEEARSTRHGLAYLIEGELEKAEIVLAAKGVLDDLQKIMENLAKIEAEDIIPLQDSLTTSYGPQVADAFSNNTAQSLRDATEAVKKSRDAISAEVAKLENILNGKPVSDMALNVGVDDASIDLPDVSTDTDGADSEFPDVGSEGSDEAPESGESPKDDAEGEVPPPPVEKEDDDQRAGAAGRIRKESIDSNKKALSESKNPDALLMAAFRKILKKTTPIKAAKFVAESFGIRVGDLVEVISEQAKR